MVSCCRVAVGGEGEGEERESFWGGGARALAGPVLDRFQEVCLQSDADSCCSVHVHVAMYGPLYCRHPQCAPLMCQLHHTHTATVHAGNVACLRLQAPLSRHGVLIESLMQLIIVSSCHIHKSYYAVPKNAAFHAGITGCFHWTRRGAAAACSATEGLWSCD